MGKHANQSVYREFERLDRLKQDEAEVMSEAERASEMCDYLEHLDAVRRYARPVGHIDLWDEPKVMACAI